MKQPEIYAEICKSYHPQDTKHIVTLTKFSGLITCWDSSQSCIKKKVIEALKEHIDKKVSGKYLCNHIYWHEVYSLLENNFSDEKIQEQLLEFLNMQRLSQSWYQDMGCPFWRKGFSDAYKEFALKNNLPKSGNINQTTWKDKEGNVKPHLGIIKLAGTDDCFAGARLQGARAAEKSGNYSLLQLNVNGKSWDLSQFFDNNAQKCVEKCSDTILKAYGKK